MTREEAIKWIEEHNNPFMDETKDSQAHRLALDALQQPEIVRCKDCKHRPKEPYESDIEFPEGSKCPCQCSDDQYYSWYPEDDWYCANGERRTDDA